MVMLKDVPIGNKIKIPENYGFTKFGVVLGHKQTKNGLMVDLQLIDKDKPSRFKPNRECEDLGPNSTAAVKFKEKVK